MVDDETRWAWRGRAARQLGLGDRARASGAASEVHRAPLRPIALGAGGRRARFGRWVARGCWRVAATERSIWLRAEAARLPVRRIAGQP